MFQSHFELPLKLKCNYNYNLKLIGAPSYQKSSLRYRSVSLIFSGGKNLTRLLMPSAPRFVLVPTQQEVGT